MVEHPCGALSTPPSAISEQVFDEKKSRPVANPAFEDAANVLIFGRPFEAGDRSGTTKFAMGKGIQFAEDATIEILLPDLLRQDPVKVQLAATLGKLWRLLSIRWSASAARSA
jgi:hypothetical protein